MRHQTASALGRGRGMNATSDLYYAMKKLFSARIVALVTLLILMSAPLMAAEYYVVIGTFADESNAKKYTSRVRNIIKDVSYSFNETRRLYYVHVMKTSRKEEARNWSNYLRHEIGFRDAWVLSFGEVDNIMLADGSIEGDNSRHAVKDNTRQVIKADNTQYVTKSSQEKVSESPQTKTAHEPRYNHTSAASVSDIGLLASAEKTSEVAKYASGSAVSSSTNSLSWSGQGDIAFAKDIDANVSIADNPALTESQVFTFIVEDSEGKALSSEVMLVNYEKVKKIASFQPGERVAVKSAKKNQMVTFVCEALGYAMETRMFNFDHLSRGRDIRKTDSGVWEVHFKMRKLEVNEIVFLNRTTFYPDAAVLDPTSDVEINELLAMMQNNPDYKIVLHGHCNPAGRREIKVPAGASYYNLEEAGTVNASDKQFTRLRAETIRNFLIDHGIDKRRIGVVGWGSIEPLVSATAEDAYINNRIELELVAE